MLRKLSAVLFVLLLVLAACDSATQPTVPDGGEGTDTTAAPESPDPTEAPPETPDTTAAPENPEGETEEGDETPWWVLLLVGGAILIIIIALLTRGSKKTTVVAAAPTWKDNARKGYAEARWLYDAMGEDVAVWRGNAQFDGTTAVGASASTGRAEDWTEMQRRLGEASDALYALEAASPDTRTAEAARATIDTMRDTRDKVDARAEARFAYRKAEDAGASQEDLIQARDREVRASRNLADSRSAFAKALTDLSAVV